MSAWEAAYDLASFAEGTTTLAEGCWAGEETADIESSLGSLGC
mgnify:CR=1 FL=1